MRGQPIVVVTETIVDVMRCKSFIRFSHHSSQSDEGALDLGVVHVLKKVVGLKHVIWFQAVFTNGSHKVSNVLQLREIEGIDKND